MKYFLISIFSSLIYWNNIFAQPDFYKKEYTPEQIQEDFQTYKEVLSSLHPSLYWHTSKQALDSIWNLTESQLNQSLSKQEYFYLLSLATTKINCGHTGTNANLDKAFDQYVPLVFRYLGNELYLHRDLTTQNEPMKIIQSINGHSVEEILQSATHLQGTDGYISSPKPLFFNNPYRFSYRYQLLYDEPNYKIQFEDGSSILRNPISEDSLKKLYPFRINPLLEQDINSDTKIAKLTINTFDKYSYKSQKLKYKKAIKAFFKEVKAAKVSHLVIDLRNNGGGEDNYASFLYRYLTDQSFQYYESMETMPLPYPEEVREKVYLPVEVSNVLLRKFFIKKKGDRYFVKATPRTKGLRMQRPNADAFLGKVYFLISGTSFSAAAELAAFAKAYRPNTFFVGQETGGAMQGNTSGLSAYLTLKNTNISAYIPLIRYRMNIDNYELGRGVLPDYPVVATPNDILTDKDVEMDFVRQLIRQK